jgi:hypothetical protein
LSEYSFSNRNRIDKELINNFSYYFCVEIPEISSLLSSSSSSLCVPNSYIVNIHPETLVVNFIIKNHKVEEEFEKHRIITVEEEKRRKRKKEKKVFIVEEKYKKESDEEELKRKEF